MIRKPVNWWDRHGKGELLCMDPQMADVDMFLEPPNCNEYREDGIAVVRIRGPLEHHLASSVIGSSKAWDCYEDVLIRAQEAFEHSEMRCVLLDIDSPGGEAAGSVQCHRMLMKMRVAYRKPLYAYANESMNSAAYCIGSACDEIWCPDTGVVGSIGVIATLFDRTAANVKEGVVRELVTSGEYKADGHADREISDGVRGRMQKRVDVFADVFWGIVAAARKTTIDAVASLEAGVFVGQQAVDVGVADGVMARDEFLDLLGRSIQQVTEEPESAPLTPLKRR